MCESCPQACIKPSLIEAKPSLFGICSGERVSVTFTQSISKRNAIVFPGLPESNNATQPVYPSIFSSHFSLAP